MKKIRTNAYDLFIDKNGIVHWEVLENSHMETSDIKESLEVALQLNKGKKLYTIVNAQAPRTMTPGAQEFLKNEVIDNNSYATAVVSERLGVKIMIEYMLNVLRVKTPLRLFTNEKDAMKWLLSVKQEKKRRTVPAFNPAADKIKKRMRTESHELYLDKNGIMHVKVVPDAHIDVNALKTYDKVSLAMNKGKKMLMLVNAKTHHSLTPDASKYLKSNYSKTRIATAVIPGGVGTKLLADFLSPHKDTPPLRLFLKEAEAVKWLLSFKKATAKKKAIPTSPKRKKPR